MKKIAAAVICTILTIACNDKKKLVHENDTPISGSITISADESFEPVIKEQIAMYESSNPGTVIHAQYKSEADCLKDFFLDSAIRMAIVTRGLTAEEEKYMTDKIGFNPGWNQLATDAVAIVLNAESTDTLYTQKKLQEELSGTLKTNKIFVFDGLNKTSTVRFIEDSVLRGKKFDTAVVKAVPTSDEVLDYIAAHNNAVGFVGINRIGNMEDTAQVRRLKRLKIAYVKCDVCVNTPYIMPSQESILNRRYPLVRGLFYLVKENYTGLGSGFVAFLKYERGQLIFKRAYLGPVMGFNVRDVRLNDKLPDN